MTGLPVGDTGRLPGRKVYPPCVPSVRRQRAAFLRHALVRALLATAEGRGRYIHRDGKAGSRTLDYSFSGEYLFTRLGKRKKTIKECLLDQNVIAYSGNLYSDEILFASLIHPEQPANTLTAEEWNQLASVINCSNLFLSFLNKMWLY